TRAASRGTSRTMISAGRTPPAIRTTAIRRLSPFSGQPMAPGNARCSGPTVAFFLRTLANGGLETHLMLLGRGLMGAGFQIVLVSDGESRVPEFSFERYSAAGFICRKAAFPGPNLGRQAVNQAVASAWQVNSLVQSVQPDLIHVHYPMTSVYAQAMHLLRG